LYKKFSEQIIAADMSDSSPKLKCRWSRFWLIWN
jgi:hypothetical protein